MINASPPRDREPSEPELELSGQSGTVTGTRRRLACGLSDAVLDLRLAVSTRLKGLDRAAASLPLRTVQILGLYWPETGSQLPGAVAELKHSRHDLRITLGALGPALPELAQDTAEENLTGGKFINLNRLLEQVEGNDADWTLIVDDDVALPRGFLDRFLFLIERHDLKLAQPALSRTSHAAWEVCRRRHGSSLRQTRFVEIGPVTAVSADAASVLMPFPELEMGWGLDLHWSALAKQHGWRVGVVDATPVKHRSRLPASAYDQPGAEEEARRFLAERPFIGREEALTTVERYKGW